MGAWLGFGGCVGGKVVVMWRGVGRGVVTIGFRGVPVCVVVVTVGKFHSILLKFLNNSAISPIRFAIASTSIIFKTIFKILNRDNFLVKIIIFFLFSSFHSFFSIFSLFF